ncbi:universal stress protein family protein [Clostridium acetireducens DSM 10703]|jgi:nucleotide-binding universal stress UspA family protein|uniref:Universal stress protein family protein n=1 Tax=Clostridium acetireducens DSM 10703 TaxID=1121290 RepID=A0A1E8EW54_9CLOT|nr:universal stress protein [Clostridium acetireducens]OFH99483.1 universal stress protein family protein [Clostridium acetireducens DSM 10703]
MPFAEVMDDKKRIGNEILDKASKKLGEFNCTKEILFGYADKEILGYSSKNNIDTIIMAKNTKKKFSGIVGSVTSQVLKKTNCVMIILPQA